VKTFRLVRHIRSSLWFIPVMCVLGGVLLSFATIAIDRRADFTLIPESLTGGPDAAIAILATVAGSMVSLAALVLTITMVVVQLAMGQFSPRIVQTFLRDKPSQFAVGLFVATFAHAMLAMREVHFDQGGSVPGLAIVVAYVLIVVSIVVLVLYVHHIGQSLRVSALLELVGSGTRKAIDDRYPDHGDAAPADGEPVIPAPRSGVVSHINHERLVEVASEAGCCLEVIPALGDFAPAGAPLVRIHGNADALDPDDVTGAMVLGLERTLEQDVPYGFRMLVDIAERSLSDSHFEDPTTAVQAIDRLHDCLRQLARRPLPPGEHRDGEGVVRLVLPSMDWEAYVDLAFEEIRRAGAASPQVSRRLRSAIEDLLTVVPAERRAPLEDQRSKLQAATEEALSDERDVELNARADGQGVGRNAGQAAS
jgi:uncharacterized membrane protein